MKSHPAAQAALKKIKRPKARGLPRSAAPDVEADVNTGALPGASNPGVGALPGVPAPTDSEEE